MSTAKLIAASDRAMRIAYASTVACSAALLLLVVAYQVLV